MSDFEDKYFEVGALWPSEYGGWSGKMKHDVAADSRIIIKKNSGFQQGQKWPEYKIYAKRPEQVFDPITELPTGDKEEAPF